MAPAENEKERWRAQDGWIILCSSTFLLLFILFHFVFLQREAIIVDQSIFNNGQDLKKYIMKLISQAHMESYVYVYKGV